MMIMVSVSPIAVLTFLTGSVVCASAILNYGRPLEDQTGASLDFVGMEVGDPDDYHDGGVISGRKDHDFDNRGKEIQTKTWRPLKYGRINKFLPTIDRHLKLTDLKRTQNDFEEIMKHVKHMSPNFMRRPSFIGKR